MERYIFWIQVDSEGPYMASASPDKFHSRYLLLTRLNYKSIEQAREEGWIEKRFLLTEYEED